MNWPGIEFELLWWCTVVCITVECCQTVMNHITENDKRSE